MMKHRVRTEQDALVYLTDCLLATVSEMAWKKSRKKHEYERHIAIAQTAVDWLKDFNAQIPIGCRAYDVLALPSQKVADWAKQYES